MNEHDRRHLKRLEAIARMVERIYDAAAEDAAAIGAMAMRMGADGEEPFSFDDHPRAKERMEELLSWLREQLEIVVGDGIAEEWLLSEDKNDALVRRVLGIEDGDGATVAYGDGERGKLPEDVRRRLFDRNEKGCEAFLKRKERGLGLSERVWRATESVPSEMAMGIDMGIRDGKSAAAMARDLKQYLKHPDKLFRRVRDERGILHLSKNAAAFHPGRGVYRSSYQNARRLAVTETNMAYRTADHERWQQLDFVVGIEVHLSGNHTCKGRDGKPHRFEDICDQLKGKYPKDFKFTGWHPHCRCYATSILKTEEELEADTQKMLRGEPTDGESVNKVEEPPKGFSDWVEKNEKRIAEAKKSGTLPGFVRENGGFYKGAFYNEMSAQYTTLVGAVELTEEEKKEIIYNIKELSRRVGLFNKKFSIEFHDFSKDEEHPKALMRWNNNTLTISTTIHRLEDGTEYCSATNLLSAMRKLRNRRTLTFGEEYSIESLFHESVHAGRVKRKDKIKIKTKTQKKAEKKARIRAEKKANTDVEIGTHEENIREVCTQLYARERYLIIMKEYGVKAINYEKIKYEGLGYSRECDRLRGFFTKNGKIQVGELINIANESINSEDVLKLKMRQIGMKEEKIEEYLLKTFFKSDQTAKS